jgi:hypothetical protein
VLMKAIKDIILKEKLCLQLDRGTNIFYVYVRRRSRTCGIPVPSVFLTGTGIPLEIST